MTLADLLAAAKEPNVSAFLRAIRLGEGTSDDNGHLRIVGGGNIDSLVDHPRKRVRLAGYGITSTAAGAYQFLAGTWDEMARLYSLPDFSPASQDAAAVGLLIRRKALDAVRAGRVREAIALCAKEWASLPGSPYGQRTESLDRVLLEYTRHGGKLTDDSAAAPTSPTGEAPGYGAPMVPILPVIAAVLPSIIQALPELGKLFGSGSEVSQRNIVGATKVLEVVTAATGSVNALEAAGKLASDPAAVAQAREAVQGVWFELAEAGGGGIDGARKADAAGVAAGWVWHRSAAFLMGLLLLPLVYMAAAAVMFQIGGDWPTEVRASALMLVLGLAVSLGGYYFGSSNKASVPGK